MGPHPLLYGARRERRAPPQGGRVPNPTTHGSRMTFETFKKAMTRRRKWLIALGAVAAILVLVVALLPIGLRHGLAAWLEGEDERAATIENVDFNPFTGAFLIEGLRVVEPTGRTLEVSRLFANLEILDLARGQVHLRALEIEDAAIEVEMDAGAGPRLVGLPESGPDREPGERPGWRFGVDALAIGNARAHLHLPDDETTLTVESLSIGKAAQWEADLASPFDIEINIAGGSVRIAGEARAFQATPSLSAQVSIDAVDLARARPFVGGARLAALEGSLSANLLARLSLENLEKLDASATGMLAFEGLAAAPALEGGAANLESESLRWEGRLDLAATGVGPMALDLNGTLSASKPILRIDPADGGTPARYASEAISVNGLKGRWRRTASGDIDAGLDSEISVKRFEGSSPGSTLGGQELAWRGQVEVTKGAAGPTAIRGSGRIESRGLELTLAGPGLDIRQDGASWEGDFTYRPGHGEGRPDLLLDATAEASGTRVDSTKLELRLVDLKTLALKGISANGTGDIRIGGLVLGGLEALQSLESAGRDAGDDSGRQIAAVGTLTASEVAFSGSHVAVGRVVAEKADIGIERLPDGEWRLLGSLLKALGPTEPDAKAEEGRPITYSVGEWRVAGESRLSLLDGSVKPAVKMTVSPVEIALEGIDSRKPGEDSPIEISARLGRYGKFDLSGTIKPLAPGLNVDVTGVVKGLELSALQGYARSYLGYDLTRGRLDADVAVRIDAGKLKADSKLVISKLEMKPADPQLARSMTRQIQVPVETALSLLRDSEDVIRLEIPVTGDAANPKFDLSDAINTAIGNAMKRTMLATVKLAFPLGGVILTLAEAAGEARLRFEPVPFRAGETELTPDADSYLGKLADLLEARPRVKITVCGAVTERDRQTLVRRVLARLRAERPQSAAPSGPSQSGTAAKPSPTAAELADRAEKVAGAELPALARGRSEAVKDRLIQGHGIDGARLFLCAPRAEPEKDPKGGPRADIYM